MILADLGTIVTGKTPSTKCKEYWNGNVPFVTPKDIQGTKHIFSTERNISDIGLISAKGVSLPPNSICVSCIGNIGYVGKTTTQCISNQQINAIIPFSKVNSDYVYYLIKWLWPFFKSYEGQSTTLSILNKTQFSKIEIPKHSLLQQNAIAAVLNCFDDKIEENERINDNLYRLLSLSFKKDYWNKVIDHPEWVMTNLDETTSRFGTGLNPRKNFVLGHGNNYYVTIKNMGNNRIYLDDRCDKIDDDAIRRIQMRSDLKVGDLLFSGIGTIGRVFLIDKPATNWNTSESVFNLRPNAKVSSEFLYLLLLNNDMQDYAISLASGSVQKGIRMADLKKYSFFLPTSDVMEHLTSLWKPLIKQIKANEVESDSLAILRDTLLPKLMSGELDVSAIEL